MWGWWHIGEPIWSWKEPRAFISGILFGTAIGWEWVGQMCCLSLICCLVWMVSTWRAIWPKGQHLCYAVLSMVWRHSEYDTQGHEHDDHPAYQSGCGWGAFPLCWVCCCIHSMSSEHIQSDLCPYQGLLLQHRPKVQLHSLSTWLSYGWSGGSMVLPASLGQHFHLWAP